MRKAFSLSCSITAGPPDTSRCYPLYAANVVAGFGLEPKSRAYEAYILPIKISRVKLVNQCVEVYRGVALLSTTFFNFDHVVPMEGLEPPYSNYSIDVRLEGG